MFTDELLDNIVNDAQRTKTKVGASNLPLKRHWSMDSSIPEVTETHGSGTGKLMKTDVIESSAIEESLSFSDIFINPQTSFDFSDNFSLKEAKMRIGRFFYENGVDFSAVKSPSFRKMVGLTEDGIPTCEELRGWIFSDELNKMHEYINSIRNSWYETGCSILLDGWMDEKGRNLINVLVDCPKGTVYLRSYDVSDLIGNIDLMQQILEEVMREVGIGNVVQIITYSTSTFMKKVGERLMNEHRSIFWTVSASACVELVLEKFGKMEPIKETLNKVKIITRFIHSDPNCLKLLRDLTDGFDLVRPCKIWSILPFLTLENLNSEKEKLKTMFLSSDPKYSYLTSTKAGKRVAELVGDRSFWSGVTTIVKATVPLARVVELMHAKDKDRIGYIYETIDQVKETIKEEFSCKKAQYERFWNVIDNVWDEHLHSPLHSAGYFLNPNLFYSEDVHIDPEVCTGLLCCIVRATRDVNVQDLMTIQLEQYRQSKGGFGLGYKLKERSAVSPAHWWSKYGGEFPELQKLAIRILSQTCEGASKFQLNRSVAEAYLTKGMYRSDMVFLYYNLQLQNFALGKNDYFTPEDLGQMNDWIVDKA